MSRSQRLFDLLQLLRCHKYPVSGDYLAQELGVSIRTIYRDIATLQAQGAEINGEAGVGYVLKPSFTLPPLMFTAQELEALRLGSEWVSKQASGEFGSAAQNAMAKIASVLPSGHNAKLLDDVIRVASIIEVPEANIAISDIKLAIQQQRKAQIRYRDARDNLTKRMIWPVLIGLFQHYYVLAAWCEKRQGFRNFRLDRIEQWQVCDQKYPRKRHDLLKEWQQLEGISDKRIGY